MGKLRMYANEAGRDFATIGIEARLNIANKPEDTWIAEVRGWQEIGAKLMGVNTMGAGLKTPEDHIEAITRVKEVMVGAGLWDE